MNDITGHVISVSKDTICIRHDQDGAGDPNENWIYPILPDAVITLDGELSNIMMVGMGRNVTVIGDKEGVSEIHCGYNPNR